MTFGLLREKDREEWLKPFVAPVLIPGSHRFLHTETRLFFELYWQLLAVGYTEEQIADYVEACGEHTRLHPELVLAQGVFHLARHWKLQVSRRFVPRVASPED